MRTSAEEMVVGMEVAYVPYEFFKDGQIMLELHQTVRRTS